MLHDTVKHKQLTHFVLYAFLRSSACASLAGQLMRKVSWLPALQMGKKERARPLDDPTRPYITFDIVAHLDSLSSHEGKRVSHLHLSCWHLVNCSLNIVYARNF